MTGPIVPPPIPFAERREALRRAADQLAYRETAMLARSLDVLALDASADARLARLLELLAVTVGARRAAVLADVQGDRRVAVSRGDGEDDVEARELAAWLDAWAPRPRSHRAAAGPAGVLVVAAGPEPGVAPRQPVPEAADPEPAGPTVPSADVQPSGPDRDRSDAVARDPDGPAGPDAPPAAQAAGSVDAPIPRHYACLPIPASGDVVLGFDFADEAAAGRLGERLPDQLARHAAVALALVTHQLATERDLEALRAREAERERFVSTVAHELRTPLTGLAGYLALILEDRVTDPADERDFLERSRQIVESMGDLVDDLLELASLESGNVRLDVGPFSVAEVGTSVTQRLAPLALTRGVRVSTNLPPRLGAATGDRRRVAQVLTNLVANGVKFAPSGSRVEVAAWFDGTVALIAVRDEGDGIAPDDRQRIFERFTRLPAHEGVGGSGLGLAIARDLAIAMGGALDVASVVGAGASFVLALPGPTGAEAGQIERCLTRALANEEIGLEERAVLRAMSAGAPRPRLVQPVAPAPDAAAAGRNGRLESNGSDEDDGGRGHPDDEGAGRWPGDGSGDEADPAPPGRPQLRAIDGNVPRNPATPA